MQVIETDNPVLIDKAILNIRRSLTDNLEWLTHAFGRCQRISKQIGKKRYFIPAIHAGGLQYADVMPSDDYGNYCFFIIHEPQTYERIPMQHGRISTPFSIVFWVNVDKILSERNTEEVKRQILSVLNTKANIKITRIWEQAENVFKGFTVDEIENQYLIHPYAGMRFEGVLTIEEECL